MEITLIYYTPNFNTSKQKMGFWGFGFWGIGFYSIYGSGTWS